uniref:F-box domain-containing protein n=1 Tax=Oryza punctata TaxID=4537 RepID=A0A0E0M5C4_ORYPU
MAENVVSVDVVHGEQEEQQQQHGQKELQLADLPDDALRSILLRLPSEPAYLAVAAAVSKNWRRKILGSNGSFLRTFRAAHDGVPPLLGFFCNRRNLPCPFFTSTVAAGVVDLSPPAGKRRPFVYDVRHGRVLLDDGKDGRLLVWDPLTRRQEVIPTPRCYFTNDNSCGAAMICGCDVPDHAGEGGGDCHWEPYRIIVAFSDLPSFCPDEWNLDRICVRVWSSGTKEWSKVYSMRGSCDFDFKPSVVIASIVHWLVGDTRGILQFNLTTKKLALIQTPVDILEFMLFPTKDRKLGFTGVLGSHIIFFHMDIANDVVAVGRTWNIRSIIPIDHFFPPHANILGTCGSLASPWVVDYYVSDSEKGEEKCNDNDYDDKTRAIPPIMQHNNVASGSQSSRWSDSWSDKDSLIPVISANVNVIGFVQEANAVLLHAAGRGVYIIDIETKHTRRVAASAYYSHVFPYTSFYTADIYENCYTSWTQVITLHLDAMQPVQRLAQLLSRLAEPRTHLHETMELKDKGVERALLHERKITLISCQAPSSPLRSAELVWDTNDVLQFNLNTKKPPLDISEFLLFPTKDDMLGFTDVLGTHIIFFHLDIARDALAAARTWSIQKVTPMDHFFPLHVNIIGTCGYLASPWGWTITSPTLMKENKKNKGVYTIHVETKHTQRVTACANFNHVFAYGSFYTAAYLIFTYGESNQLSTTMACVYSSRTNTWHPVTTMDGRVAFDLKQPAVLDNTIYTG